MPVLVHDGYELVLYRGSGSSDDVGTTFSTNELSGTSDSGTWTLRVADAASQDEGILSKRLSKNKLIEVL